MDCMRLFTKEDVLDGDEKPVSDHRKVQEERDRGVGWIKIYNALGPQATGQRTILASTCQCSSSVFS